MAISLRITLPDSLGNEASKYNELLYKGNTRTIVGNVTFTSTTSSTTYSTLTSYSGTYANQGENGLFNMLKIEVLADYLLDNDWVDSISTTVSDIDTSVSNLQADIGQYVVPTAIVGQLITIPHLTTASIYKLKIETTVTGGNITINDGSGALPLLNVDGTNVTELSQDTKYFEVVKETVNFTLLPKGGVKEFFGDGSDGTISDLGTIASMPSGGVLANIIDRNDATNTQTNALTTGINPILKLSYSVPTPCIGVYFKSIKTNQANGGRLYIQYSDDDINWYYDYAGNYSFIGSTLTSVNIKSFDSKLHKYWRVVADQVLNNDIITIAGIIINYVVGDNTTTFLYRIVEPSTLNGGAVIKQYTQYTLPVGYEHTVQNPCQGLVIYSQGDAVVNGVIDMSQKAGLAPNGNPIPMPIIPSYIEYSEELLDSYVKSQLHMDGANNGTTFTDVSGKVWTATENAVTKTSDKKYGTASAYFDGNGDSISTPDSEDFNLSNVDWTFDFWFKRLAIGSSQTLFSQSDGSGTASTVSIWVYFDASNILNVVVGNGSTITTYATGIAMSDLIDWHHLEISRYGTFLQVFIDGVQKYNSSVLSGFTFGNSTQVFAIGARNVSTTSFNGYIDEFRFSKGIARHTTNFKVNKYPYSDSLTIRDTYSYEAFKEMYQLTTVLQTLRGGYGGNGGYGGGYSGSTGRQSSVGIGGAGRQNLGGFGGGGSGGGYSGTWSLSGGVGGSILFAELGGGVLTGGMPLNSNNSAFTVNGINGSGAFAPVINSGSGYTINSGKCNGAGGGGCGPMTSGSAGDGEYAGGFVLFICKGSFTNSGTIKSNGGKGGNGWSVVGISNSGGGGGGGGAGGGVVSILHKGAYSNTGTLQVNGGVGGSAGTGVSVGEAGGSGTSGSVGTINIQQL